MRRRPVLALLTARVRARRRARDDDDVGSSTVEFVICAVLMITLLLVIVQFALYFHLRAVATTAARHGVDRVRVLDGSETAGITAANEFLDQAGSSLENRTVNATRSATDASVTVTGRVVAVIPGLSLHVTAEVHAPTERIEP